MLISCPGCHACYQFAEDTVGADGVILRCFRCRSTFRLVRRQAQVNRHVAAMKLPRPEQPVRLVVAHESPSFCAAVTRVVAGEPIQVHDCHDGGEALALIRRLQPEVVLLDVALPTMFGFEICEAMRKDESLADCKIILLAAIYDKRRYRRDPASLYGADAIIEKHRIPEELVSQIYTLLAGGPRRTAVATIAPSALEEPVQAPALSPSSLPAESPDVPVVFVEPAEPESVPADDDTAQQFVDDIVVEADAGSTPPPPAVVEQDQSEGHLKARRLARIIVSDIALYNPEKVVQGIRAGTIQSLLAEEYAEGEGLYAQRVAEEIRQGTDYLSEAWQQLIAKKQRELGGEG